jgi:hypothetical protein
MQGDSTLGADYFMVAMRWSEGYGSGGVALRLLSIAALSAVSCANEGEWVDATQAPEVKFDRQRQGCLVEIGCQSQPLALPDCWSGAALGDGPTDARVGQRVVLDGYLQVEEWAQTMGECPAEQPCCNGHSARLVLTTQRGPVWLLDRRRPQAFSCSGDRSLACCAFDSLGSRIKARGVLARHEQRYWGHVISGYRLDEPELCRIGKR